MIDLYAAATSNSMRARMALEECGLAYSFHPVALEKGEHKTPQFVALNPNAQVPVIVDHEGPGGKPITLSQSTAILIYCAEKSGKLMPKESAARAAMWQALMSGSTDITPQIGSIFAVQRSREPHAPTAKMAPMVGVMSVEALISACHIAARAAPSFGMSLPDFSAQ